MTFINRPENERKFFQRVIAVLSFVPLVAGLFGILYGPGTIGNAISVSADSHYRYLSGLLLAIGIGFMSSVPDIENNTGRFRLLTFIVVTGGLGRLFGLVTTGLPSIAMLGGLGMELIVTPILCLWQSRIAMMAPLSPESVPKDPVENPF